MTAEEAVTLHNGACSSQQHVESLQQGGRIPGSHRKPFRSTAMRPSGPDLPSSMWGPLSKAGVSTRQKRKPSRCTIEPSGRSRPSSILSPQSKAGQVWQTAQEGNNFLCYGPIGARSSQQHGMATPTLVWSRAGWPLINRAIKWIFGNAAGAYPRVQWATKS